MIQEERKLEDSQRDEEPVNLDYGFSGETGLVGSINYTFLSQICCQRQVPEIDDSSKPLRRSVHVRIVTVEKWEIQETALSDMLLPQKTLQNDHGK